MEQTYDVTIARFGHVSVKAKDRKSAMELANAMPSDEIHWSEDWTATDAEEADPFGTCGIDVK